MFSAKKKNKAPIRPVQRKPSKPGFFEEIAATIQDLLPESLRPKKKVAKLQIVKTKSKVPPLPVRNGVVSKSAPPKLDTRRGTQSAPGRKVRIPIKLKFLIVILSIMFVSFSSFFYYADNIFSEDKKLFIMDLNMASLAAANSDVKFEIKSRLEEIQVIAPRVYNPIPDQFIQYAGKFDPFQGLSESVKEELIAVTFYRKSAGETEAKQIRRFVNKELLAKHDISFNFPTQISETHPPDIDRVLQKGSLTLMNRSMSSGTGKLKSGISILTFLVSGSFIDAEAKDVIIVVDVIQDFLRKRLGAFDLASVFLLTKSGELLSHPQLKETLEFAGRPFPHPVGDRLAKKHLPKEGMDAVVNGMEYLVNFSTTSFDDIFVVSQIQKSQAFEALYQLRTKSILIGLIILFSAVIISVAFAARLTSNIERLKQAAEQVGAGNLDLTIKIKSNDEVEDVYSSFKLMTARLKALMAETANKARMENELRTAQIVQATLLTPPQIETDAVEILSHLVPASEIGGDFWDAHIIGSKLTVIIGDATGHGAPAALVTAIAKSSFSTLNTVYYNHSLEPEQFLNTLNSIIHSTCKGSLLMTMCLFQLDLQTGELKICNAGHESPMCLRGGDLIEASDSTDKPKRKKKRAEILFARGERLGFSAATTYQSETYRLKPGDVLMLYTDGISEAENPEGKEWGERELAKTFSGTGPRELTLMKTEIESAVTAHMNGREALDDITFVLCKWNRVLDDAALNESKARISERDSGLPAMTRAGSTAQSRQSETLTAKPEKKIEAVSLSKTTTEAPTREEIDLQSFVGEPAEETAPETAPEITEETYDTDEKTLIAHVGANEDIPIEAEQDIETAIVSVGKNSDEEMSDEMTQESGDTNLWSTEKVNESQSDAKEDEIESSFDIDEEEDPSGSSGSQVA